MLELYTIFARNMPEFYIRPYVFLKKNIFPEFFLGGRGGNPLAFTRGWAPGPPPAKSGPG